LSPNAWLLGGSWSRTHIFPALEEGGRQSGNILRLKHISTPSLSSFFIYFCSDYSIFLDMAYFC
jgi:hypothetical protein